MSPRQGETRPRKVHPCPNGKVKYDCVDCIGCPHGKRKHKCTECTPCPHGRVKNDCVQCTGCPHGELKHKCATCTPCPHGKVKRNCAECKTAGADPPSLKRVKREPEIKQEPEPFTIRGYFGFDDGQ